MTTHPSLRLLLALIVAGGLVALPACGSNGVREAEAARGDDSPAVAMQHDDDESEEYDTEYEEPLPPAGTASVPKPATPVPSQPRSTAPAVPARSAAAAQASDAVRMTVPSDTPIDVELLEPLSSETSLAGDSFRTRVIADVMVDGQVAIPAGAEVTGVVTEAVASKKIGGQARIALQFDRIQLASGESAAFNATIAAEGQKQTRKDSATIGGSAAGGALLGRVLSRKKGKGTAVGAVVGAAVGTAIAAGNESDPVNLDQGAVLRLMIENPIGIVKEGTRIRFDTTTAGR